MYTVVLNLDLNWQSPACRTDLDVALYTIVLNMVVNDKVLHVSDRTGCGRVYGCSQYASKLTKSYLSDRPGCGRVYGCSQYRSKMTKCRR